MDRRIAQLCGDSHSTHDHGIWYLLTWGPTALALYINTMYWSRLMHKKEKKDNVIWLSRHRWPKFPGVLFARQYYNLPHSMPSIWTAPKLVSFESCVLLGTALSVHHLSHIVVSVGPRMAAFGIGYIQGLFCVRWLDIARTTEDYLGECRMPGPRPRPDYCHLLIVVNSRRRSQSKHQSSMWSATYVQRNVFPCDDAGRREWHVK